MNPMCRLYHFWTALLPKNAEICRQKQHTMEQSYRNATPFEQQICTQIIEYLDSNPNEDIDLHRIDRLLVKMYSKHVANRKGYAAYIGMRLNIDRKTVYKYDKS